MNDELSSPPAINDRLELSREEEGNEMSGEEDVSDEESRGRLHLITKEFYEHSIQRIADYFIIKDPSDIVVISINTNGELHYSLTTDIVEIFANEEKLQELKSNRMTSVELSKR